MKTPRGSSTLRSRTATSLVVLATIFGATALPQGPAGASEPGSAPSLAQLGAGFDEGMSVLASARAAVASGSLEDVVLGAARLSGSEVVPPSDRHFHPQRGVPRAIAHPVARLVAAVTQATGMARRAISVSPVALARLDRRVTAAEAAGDARSLEAMKAEVDAAVDHVQMEAAAAVVARAVDQTLPELEAYAAAHPSSGPAAACDMANALPALCIGGSGDNTYDKDAALVIDMGGNDVHTNSAGGADPAPKVDTGYSLGNPTSPPSPSVAWGNSLLVSVTIDTAGNDTYDATLPSSASAPSLPNAGGAWYAQGAASAGVGILVDAAGDDKYSAATKTTNVVPRAQGASVLGGVGILDDRGGNDVHRVSYLAPAKECAPSGGCDGAQGLGTGGLGGLGIMLDESGDDSYVVQSRPTVAVDKEGSVYPGTPSVSGIGVATGGVGLFADGGGRDSMLVEAVASPLAPDDLRTTRGGSARVQGLGYSSVGGTGVAMSLGSGDTSWSGVASARGPFAYGASVEALGAANIAGAGVLFDQGGNDTYRGEATVDATTSVTASKTCKCGGVEARADSTGDGVGDAQLGAIGWATTGSVALLDDSAGNDHYVLEGTSRATATARDQRTKPAPASVPEIGAIARAQSGNVLVRGQGVGVAFSPQFGQPVPEGGFLQDSAGDDTYEATATSEAVATSAAKRKDALEQGYAYAGSVRLDVQGAAQRGYGQLFDGGGADTYSAIGKTSAAATPTVEKSVGVAQTSAQGSVHQGVALFQDSGAGEDEFVAVPEDAACTGIRGKSLWKDCGGDGGSFPAVPADPGVGLGINQ